MAYRGLTIIFASFLLFLGHCGYSNGQCAQGECTASDLGSSPLLQRYPAPADDGCYSNNDVVQLNCTLPGIREGPSSYTCTDGLWGNVQTTCKVYCSPPDIVNLKLDPNQTRYEVGDEVTFSCTMGHKLTPDSPTSAHCTEMGYLNATQQPECIAFSCPAPRSTDENLDWTDEGTKDTYNGDETISYSCPEGFKVEGNDTNTCIDQNDWQNEDPTCSAFNCSAPSSTDENLDWTGKGNETYNGDDTITYSCPEGFKLEGSETNTCTDQDEWDNEDPTCNSGNVVQVFWYFFLMTTFYSIFSFYM